ncbi:MAG: hypothetical protein ACKOWE_02790 [Micrococcales bacterium]
MATNKIQLTKKLPTKVVTAAIASILAIAAAGLWFFQSQQQTYWVVNVDAPAGSNLAELPLRQLPANLAEASKFYLAGNAKPTGFLLQPLEAGQLIATSNLSETKLGDTSKVVVSITNKLTSTIHATTQVQVWVATRFGSELAPATVLIEQAEVVRAVESDSMFQQSNPEVELQVPTDSLPALLDAMASESAIYLVANS